MTEPGERLGTRRIQRQRTKGWRMPEGAVYVGRPSRWGNPYIAWPDRRPEAPVKAFAEDMRDHEAYDPAAFARWLEPLRGHDLACWCPLDQPCHADVLLELANRHECQCAEARLVVGCACWGHREVRR